MSWIALKAAASEVHHRLGLRAVGEPDDSGLPLQYVDISAAELPGGWYLLYFNEYDHPLVGAKSLSRLSSGMEIVACQIEEHVMVSQAGFYRGGEAVWAIGHDAGKGVYHLGVRGAPPEEYKRIDAEMTRQQQAEGGEQADVDMVFDVPLAVAELLCGYRHDHYGFAWGSPSFIELARIVHATVPL